ncbi:MAG: sigma-54-dependent transcriptional regulator [Fusobacteriaceae bacterium]
MNVLGFKLDNELKAEFESSADNVVSFSEEIVALLNLAKTKKFDAIIIDEKNFQEESLLNLISKLIELQKKAIIIIIGETSNLKLVAGSIKAGAYDYLLKPMEAKRIVEIVTTSVKAHKMMAERVEKQKGSSNKLIGHSRAIVEVYKKIGRVGKSMVPVLIVGEKGIGKSSVAKAIHEFSMNSDKPFININCLVLGNELIERKLFGYEKGAFPGAIASQAGDLEKINNGTLHIGNIHALNLELQSKLLYFLEHGEFFRMGSAIPLESHARIIVSTTEDIESLIQKNKFIAELYSKLRVLEVMIPPLRDRKDDIPFIVDHYIEQCNRELGTSIKGVSKPALKKMLRYDWPGNVNELKNAVKSAIAISSSETILLEDLPSNVLGGTGLKLGDTDQDTFLKNWIRSEIDFMKKNSKRAYYENIVAKVEKELIHQILEMTNGKKVESADLLGITRNTLRTKMNNYDLE